VGERGLGRGNAAVVHLHQHRWGAPTIVSKHKEMRESKKKNSTVHIL
jgi:hypothetical protein